MTTRANAMMAGERTSWTTGAGHRIVQGAGSKSVGTSVAVAYYGYQGGEGRYLIVRASSSRPDYTI